MKSRFRFEMSVVCKRLPAAPQCVGGRILTKTVEADSVEAVYKRYENGQPVRVRERCPQCHGPMRFSVIQRVQNDKTGAFR
jgi:hypothetical protein